MTADSERRPPTRRVSSFGLSTRRVGDRRSNRGEFIRAHPCHPWLILQVKPFYTGPVINTEMLVVMLEKHDIAATQEFVDPTAPDDGDLNRLATVFVPEADFERAHRLFYAEREDEF